MRVYAFIIPLAGAAVLPPQKYLPATNPTHHATNGFRIPTVHESAIMARRMLRLEGSGTLSTIFPSHQTAPHTNEQRPDEVSNTPFGLPEYIADCEPSTGHPTILQVDIATTFKNAQAGSNVTLSVSWHPPGKLEGEYSGAMMPRYALVGWLQEMDLSKKEEAVLRACYIKKHPDTIWAPGSDIHVSRWVRLIVEDFYWFGGFGDRARIQWIGLDEWHGVTEEEIKKCRLPGETGKADDTATEEWTTEL